MIHTIQEEQEGIRRGNYRGNRDVARNRLRTARFIAWDGEGYTDSQGEHHYVLFGNRTECIVSESGNSIHFIDAFELLLDTASRTTANHIIYGGDYDVIMMTKGMPFNVLDRLLKGMPVRYGGYRMQWFRRKYFQLSDGTRSIMLYDVISFFQTTFVKACVEYLGNDETLIEMAAMKARRNTFTLDMLEDEVIPYWESELQYLERLMDVLRNLMAEVDIYPNGWFGPGAVASAILKRESIDSHFVDLIDPIVDAAERSFYGGRFEQFYVGYVENAHEYDIRSAYPAAITKLPSFADAVWTHVDAVTDVEVLHNPYALVRVRWNMLHKPSHISRRGPLPWRDGSGNVYYPLIGSGWYWAIEARNLMTARDCEYSILEAWIPQWTAGIRYPFKFVEGMYTDRARMKAAGNPAQRALKLGMNSLYGKLAQSKGAKRESVNGEYQWKKPRWHQIIWAGWITAFCRGKLWEAMTLADKMNVEVIAVETDALFVNKPLPLIESDSLGDWDHIQLEKLLYIQSGVYCAQENGKWSFKSRGTEGTQAYDSEKWMEICRQLPQTPVEIRVSLNRFGTVLRSTTYARWYNTSKTVQLPSLSSKRMHHEKLCKRCLTDEKNSFADGLHHLVVPQPMLVSDAVGSVPYKFPWREDGAKWNREVSVLLESEPEMEFT